VGRRSVRNLTEDVRRTTRLRVGGPAVGYLGYVGRDNAGDEAILQGQRVLHPDAVLEPMPLGLQWGRVLAALGRRRVPALGGRAVLLGGGGPSSAGPTGGPGCPRSATPRRGPRW
jgi:hypothetical protein